MRIVVTLQPQTDARLELLAERVLAALQAQDRVQPFADMGSAARWLQYALQHPDLHVYRFDGRAELHHRRRHLITLRPER